MIVIVALFEKLKILKKHPGLKRYFTNTTWLLFDKLFRMAIGLFVSILVIRYLGPQQFGILSYAVSVVALFSSLSSLGLDEILVRELVKNPQMSDSLLGSSFILRIIGSFIVLSFIFLFLLFVPTDHSTIILILIISSSTFFQCLNIIDHYFQGEVKVKYISLTNSAAIVVSSLIKVILILFKAPLVYFAINITLDSILIASGYFYSYQKFGLGIKRWSFDKAVAKKLLSDSWPLILGTLAISFYMRIDQIMIAHMLGNHQLGIYAAAVKISEFWYFIPGGICVSLFPAIINAKATSQILYKQRFQNLYNLMIGLSLPVAILITIFSSTIIKYLYGSSYQESTTVLVIHIWSGIFVSLGVASTKFVLSENLQIISLLNTAIGALINIILNFFFIRKWGIQGAALATLISYFFSAYFCFIFYKQTRSTFVALTKSLLLTGLFYAKKNH